MGTTTMIDTAIEVHLIYAALLLFERVQRSLNRALTPSQVPHVFGTILLHAKGCLSVEQVQEGLAQPPDLQQQ